jgi:hypothetical protein
MSKLTKRFIEGLRPKPSFDVFAWDGELRGFGVRIKPSGAGSYLVQYRTPQGRTRRFAFGRIATLTPDEARSRAKRLLAEVESGGDPSTRRHQEREALTVALLCERYLEAAHAGLVITRFRRAKRASTIAIDEGRVKRHIAPLIGSQIVGTLNRVAIQRMADAIAAGKTAGVFRTKARGKALVRGGPGVFPSVSASKSADLKKAIAALFNASGLTDARAHDLRRSFASVAADEGYSDATIAELLGHARRGVTARHCIRRPDAALLAAASCVSERIATMLDDLESCESVAVRQRDNDTAAAGADGNRDQLHLATISCA